MLRVFSIRRLFTQFYHPCKVQVDANALEQQICRLGSYIGTYRQYAHNYSKLDPLQLYNKKFEEFVRPIDFGIKFDDSLSKFTCKKSPVIQNSENIQELEKNLQKIYQSNTGIEFSHIASLQEKQWLYHNYQKYMMEEVSNQKKIQIAKFLVQSEVFDSFLHKKFVTFKIYSGEGAQGTVFALNQLFEKSTQLGYSHIVFGMPHRGRLNTLINILNFQPRYLFRKISGKTDTPKQLFTVIDDVTNHIAHSVVNQYNSKKVKITMVHNPSHLQAQNPVSMGKTRSKQHLYGKDKVINIQVHGDAAICAQGIVYESFCLGKVPKFDIGGTIHIITNNQLGYSTRPIDSRASKYCTDIGKAFDTPILHINSENIEDVYKIMSFCVEYKTKFNKDILVDLICYRKYGHNEAEQPEFTQPKMYKRIRKEFVSNLKKYPSKLHQEGLISENFPKQTEQNFQKFLQSEFEAYCNMPQIALKDYTNPQCKGSRAFTEQWSKFKPSLFGQEYDTGFDLNLLKQFALTSVSYPIKFAIHPRIKKYHVDERIKSLENNSLNWTTCEAMALFNINFEGYNIRFTGQDVERGTFSQRHINLVDQNTEQTYNSLEEFAKMSPGRGEVQIFNSPLSQNAVLSYQYGYSLDHPHNLTIWEAQFGDFFNTAQVAIDNYLTNSENKWVRQTGLVLILPHGYDGAGPEHSSCRIQRFLQLANSDGKLPYKKLKTDKQSPLKMDGEEFWQDFQSANFSMVYPTKPSNMFHVLRRQMKRNFRKPLIIAGPKGLLRLNKCTSSIQEMQPGTKFQRIWKYKNVENIQNCEVVILCSGKYVYDVDDLIQKQGAKRTGLLSIQQIFPFPETQLKDLLKQCNKNVKVLWIQQENINSGAFQFIYPRLLRVVKQLGFTQQIKYVGRQGVATTAVGSSQLHKKQSVELTNWIKSLLK